MQIIEVQSREHPYRFNDEMPHLAPNIDYDCIMQEDGMPVGAYWHQAPKDLHGIADIADAELRSGKFPISRMDRLGRDDEGKAFRLPQVSAILGSSAPQAHMRAVNARRSRLHAQPAARNFIKAMSAFGRMAMELVRGTCPHLYAQHIDALEREVSRDWRFADYFTSSISNANSAANLHQDRKNARGALNIIYVKRWQSRGGHLVVPEYDAVFAQPDHSMLVYPAWRNAHAVTPIVPLRTGGYRNAHVFYALRTTTWGPVPDFNAREEE